MSEPEPVLVSACLLGRQCRYDGAENRDLVLEEQLRREGLRAVPFCPEEAGGLPTPRPPAWLSGGDAAAVLNGQATLVTDAGADVGAAFRSGAEQAVELCRAHGIRRAFLKERSPSCGVCQTHRDGVRVEGPGVTAQALQREGVRCEGIEGRRTAP
jgi:uncharacterized protein YbbK (DUF523 family)